MAMLHFALAFVFEAALVASQTATCDITRGFDFTGNDLVGPDGKPRPQPSADPGACCDMCIHKDPAAEPKGKCSAWSWNPGTKTCWMKTGRGTKPNQNGDISGQVVPPQIISGQGDWRYQFVPDLVKLPSPQTNNDLNGHGLTKDNDGNIYFTFVPKTVGNDTQVLVKFKPDGTKGLLLGAKGRTELTTGVPHGLRIEHDPVAKESYFYHANNDAKIMKSRLDGSVMWTADLKHWQQEKPQYWPIRPCDAIVVPGTDILVVADGYGSSFIHWFDKHTGKYIENRTFGGKGLSTSDPIKFNTPHGINVDPRHPGTLVISDRTNERLVWITPEGKYVGSMPTSQPAGMSLPCNVDVHTDFKAGQVAVVPSLGMSYSNLNNGSVAIYDQNNSILSVIEVAANIGYLGHQHPHDAMFMPNGDVVVCCWSGPPNSPEQGAAEGTISYWKRLPASGAASEIHI